MSKLVKVGDRIGRLVVIRKTDNPNSKAKSTFWLCQCDCGKTTITHTWQLSQNVETKSCGCWRNEIAAKRSRKHGDLNSKLNYVYRGMRGRCDNEKNPSYKHYGGRGITICEEWNEYADFMKWSHNNGYEEGLTIDRIDNDKGYSPDNCRWVNLTVQANNKRNNDYIEFEGKTQSISDWAREKGLLRATVWARLYKYGWTLERSLSTPPWGHENKRLPLVLKDIQN